MCLLFYETFPNPAPWLGTAFEEIVTFLWVQGYYEEALPYAIKVYESVMNYYGSNHVLPGREALRVAAVYHNRMDHDQALMWYQKGYELLKAVTPRTFEVMDQLSTACGKLAKEYSHRQDPVAGTNMRPSICRSRRPLCRWMTKTSLSPGSSGSR